MITLLLLLITSLIGIVFAVVFGAGFLLIFGDLIFAIVIIAFIVKKIIGK